MKVVNIAAFGLAATTTMVAAKTHAWTKTLVYTGPSTTFTRTTTHSTHRYGRFNKTKKSEKPKNTGTHRYGRFNKTKKSKKPKNTGTHRYGRFNKTKHHSKTPDVKLVQPNAGVPMAHGDSMKLFGLTAGSAVVAGAFLLL
ncbi:hypothetical protein MOUN0_O12574 [Monosporozyma unispora]|nr:hypothetical protein C6P44_000060 [Kazachstania unispora]